MTYEYVNANDYSLSGMYLCFLFFLFCGGGGDRLIQQNYNKLKIVNFRNHENPKLWGMREVGGGVADVNLYFQHSTFISSHFNFYMILKIWKGVNP